MFRIQYAIEYTCEEAPFTPERNVITWVWCTLRGMAYEAFDLCQALGRRQDTHKSVVRPLGSLFNDGGLVVKPPKPCELVANPASRKQDFNTIDWEYRETSRRANVHIRSGGIVSLLLTIFSSMENAQFRSIRHSSCSSAVTETGIDRFHHA